MDIVKAILYGIVQGLTEFLPVSSNAHIRIVGGLLHEDPGAAFTAIIQLGTVAAVILYFAKDLGKAFMAWWYSITGKKDVDQTEARIGWAVFVGTLPIIALGFAFHEKIETTLRSLNIVATALIGFGLVMLVADRMKHTRKINDVTVKDGLVVGLWQCLALIPGVSRSGSTISGALFQGFDRVAAARFSFLLSIPSVTAAGLYEAYKVIKHADPGSGIQWGPTIVATIVSFIVGYVAIKFFISYLQKHGIAIFVWYRVALGIVILLLVQQGIVDKDAGAAVQQAKPPAVSQSGHHVLEAREG